MSLLAGEFLGIPQESVAGERDVSVSLLKLLPNVTRTPISGWKWMEIHLTILLKLDCF